MPLTFPPLRGATIHPEPAASLETTGSTLRLLPGRRHPYTHIALRFGARLSLTHLTGVCHRCKLLANPGDGHARPRAGAI